MLSLRVRRLVRLLACAVIALSIAPPAVAARWYEDYQKALDLMGGGGCSQEAISLLQSALEDRGKPAANARTLAVRPIRYIPYYQLAKAYLACGNAAAAKVYLGRAREYGVASADELAVIEKGLAAAAAQQQQPQGTGLSEDELATLLAQVRDSVNRADEAAERLASEQARPQADRLMAQTPPLGDRVRAAQADLTKARRSLHAGDKATPLEILQAGNLAARSTQEFEAVRSELVLRRSRMAAAQPTATPERVVRLEPTATPTPRPQPPTPTPTRPLLATPRPSAPPLATATPTPSAPVVRGVPEPLREAVVAYLRADYEGTLRPLADASLGSPRAQVAAHLLEAAARFALYVSGGSEDEQLRGQAVADVRAGLRLDPSLAPDPALFSPRFVEFFRAAAK